MHKISRKTAFGSLLVALAAAILPASSINSHDKSRTIDTLSALAHHSLAFSVAWSPKGDRIAFISDGIWIVSLSKGQLKNLTRLTRPTRKGGTPVALFWLDNNRVGWAAAHYSEWKHTFSFMQMRLQDSKPKRLTSQIFSGVQNRPSMESAFGGPDDVYYDADSQTLLFSGGVMPSGVYVKILSLYTGDARKLFVPGADEAAPVTLCGSLRNLKIPQFYIATVMHKPAFGWRIWRSNSYSLHSDKVLVTSPERYLQFPRISPDSKLLAYFSIEGKTGHGEIMLYDLRSGKHRTVVALSSQWLGDQTPAMGCPFSWSPDGKKIAYADGSRIKIVNVPASIGKK